MKEFIKKTLQRLPFLAGVDQLKGMDTHTAGQLVQELLAECSKHKIPEDKKQELILSGIKSEEYFKGLTVALIHKWFYAWRVANQHAGIQPDDTDDYWRIKRRNDAFYKNQLAEIRKGNPSYDPAKEALDQIKRFTQGVVQKPKTKTKKVQGDEAEYEEVKN